MSLRNLLPVGIQAKIDKMSYEQMLRAWRFSPSGNLMFLGENGRYFKKEMEKKKSKLAPGEHTKISKSIGF